LPLNVTEVATGTSGLTVTATAGGTTDLSKLTFSPGTYIGAAGTVLAGNALTSGTDLVRINGGAGTVETIVGTSIADVIIGDSGADVMTGGLGTNVFRFAALGDVTLNTPDTITDFDAVTANILSFNAAGGGSFGLVGGNTLSFFKGAQNAFAQGNNVVVVTTAVTGDLTSANAATAIGNATGNYANTDFVLFVVSNNTSSAVFYFDSAAADATVTAAELGAGPIITLTGVNTAELTLLAAGNFTLA